MTVSPLTENSEQQREAISSDTKKTIAIVAATILCLVLVLWKPTMDSLTVAREMALRTKCQKNLTQIRLGSEKYSNEHNAEWPKHLDDLYPEYIGDPSVFVCPNSKDKVGNSSDIDAWSSYEIVHSGKAINDKDTVVVQDKNDHAHRPGGRNYLFANGQVKYRPTEN